MHPYIFIKILDEVTDSPPNVIRLMRLVSQYRVVDLFDEMSVDALTIDQTQRPKQENQDLRITQAQEIAQQAQEITELKAQMHQMELKNLEMWKKSLLITLEGMDRFDNDTQRFEIQN
jgi:hypothetical protein